MKSRAALLTVIGGLTAALLRADLPPAHGVRIFPANTVPNGASIPEAPPTEAAHPAAIPLWPNGAPGAEARRNEPEDISWRQNRDIVFPIISNIHNPSLTPFLPAKEKATGCAVIIAPGGGHMFLTIDREGYDVGRLLAAHGIAAFVLKARLARDCSTPANQPQPYTVDRDALADARRAIRLVRSHAAEWAIKPDRIGIMGFSAGGEITLLAAARSESGRADASDPVERVSSRPDFFAPIYPGNMRRMDLTWSKETPPAFLLCAADDSMPDQLAALFTTLKGFGVSAELHIYSRGGHGFGVRTDRPTLEISAWPDRFIAWLGDRGLLQ